MYSAAASQVGSLRFEFVAAKRPLIQGAIGALAFEAIVLAWAWLSGRIQGFDPTYSAVIAASTAVALTVGLGGTWRRARKAALMLGHLEVDDAGVRWHRPNAALGFDVSWSAVERATVDAGNATMVLFGREGPVAILGVLSEHGVPSGSVVLDRFEELTEVVTQRVPTASHVGRENRPAARRTILLGLFGCVVATAMYCANLTLGAVFEWTRLSLPIPVFVAAVSVLGIAAGVRIHLGRGPLVSPIYGSSYPRTVIRFLVVASIANFVIVAIANTLAM